MIINDGVDDHRIYNFSFPIQLTLDLLTWISPECRIPCSFTNFITTPELSGPLYISPSIFHTQITEFLLKSIYQ